MQPLTNIAPTASKKVRENAQLKQQSENLHKVIDLLAIHERVEEHFEELFNIFQIYVVFQQFQIPQENVIWIDYAVRNYGNNIGNKITFEVCCSKLFRILLLLIGCLTHLEKVKKNVQNLDEANVKVLRLLIHVITFNATHIEIITHNQSGNPEVKKERDCDD